MHSFQDTKNNINENQDPPSEKKSFHQKDSFFEESFIIPYEGEGEDESDVNNTNESNEMRVQNLAKINYMFNKAGCGMTNDEVNLIGITMNQLSRLEKFKNIR